MGLDYYYKIYVVKPTGVYGTGSNEVPGKTDYIRTYPFSDDLEDEASTIENWDLYSWGRTNDSAHSGAYSLADSPGSDYSNNQVKSLTTSIDLNSAQAQIPQLRFWQKYSLGNGDYATIEVSTDLDRTWKCIYYTSGVQLNWHQIKVDLNRTGQPYTVHLFPEKQFAGRLHVNDHEVRAFIDHARVESPDCCIGGSAVQ